MFSFKWSEKKDPVGVIRHKNGKHPKALGLYTDADGKGWDINGIYFNPGCKDSWVQACPKCNLHPYYTDTSTNTYGLVSQRWEPYLLEEINE